MDSRTLDYILSGLMKSPDTPPFIGLVSPPEEHRHVALNCAKSFLDGNPGRISELFRQFPYIAAWCLTQALSECYGDGDQAVYRHIEDALGVGLDNQNDRKKLYRCFCHVCTRLGLPTHGFDRFVDVYLLHTGVPIARLPDIVDAFLRQEAAFGLPPMGATTLINRWEDEALEFLPDSIVTPRRAIQWDATAWHASLYARIRPNPEAYEVRSPFEKCFRECLLEENKQGSRASRRTQSVARPKIRLVWCSDGLALRLPKTQGRIKLWQDHDPTPSRLFGGEDWILSQPWPRRLRWSVGEFDGQMDFLSAEEDLAIFDVMTGYLAEELTELNAKESVDVTNAVVLSRTEFSIDGESASGTDEAGYSAFIQLTPSPRRLTTRFGTTQLSAKPCRRLGIHGPRIANGPQGPLYGASAEITVETGFEYDEDRRLRVAIQDYSADVTVPVIQGLGRISIADLLLDLPKSIRRDPLRMRIDLLAPGADDKSVNSTGIFLERWVWPAFSKSDGVVFECDEELGNLVLDHSHHVKRDSRGWLALDASGGYLAARATFRIGDQLVPFDFPWPHVVVFKRRRNGSMHALPIGSRLTLDNDDRDDAVIIRCPYPDAQLSIRGRLETSPFAHGLSRNLSVRDLLEPASDNRVVLYRPNGIDLLLFEVFPSIEPVSVQPLPATDEVRLRLILTKPIDALALEMHDEHQSIDFVEASLGRRPVSTRCPRWLSVDLPNGNPEEIDLTVSQSEFDDGIAIARIFVRPDEASEGQHSWHPLRNAKGQTFAIAVGNPDSECLEPEIKVRFNSLSKWLADQYAVECWPKIEERVVPRWTKLGYALAKQHGGKGVMMMAALTPPPDHSPHDWMPVKHPIHLIPDLYGEAPEAFAGLAVSHDRAIADLSKLFNLSQMRLREQTDLDPAVYLGFQNSINAEHRGVPLEGFTPKKYFSVLTALDTDPSAGWFWRDSPILGAEHWRAAHLRYVERFEETDIFQQSEMTTADLGRRAMTFNKVINQVWRDTPIDLRPPVPPRDGRDEPEDTDLWVSASLSGFARASRDEEVRELVKGLQNDLMLSQSDILGAFALLLRLAPELLTFFLLMWQLAKERP